MKVRERILTVIEGFSGIIGVYAKHMGTGEEIAIRPDEDFETASSIKVPIMVEVFRQAAEARFALTDALELTRENQVAGSGVLKELTPGTRLSVRDAVMLMIIVSDNTATNMCIDLVGVESVNATMRALGLQRTTLHRKIAFPFTTTDRLGTNTPREYGRLLELIYRGEAADRASCDAMLDIMRRQQYHSHITRYLPYELLRPPEQGDPPVRVASKSGSLRGGRIDGGVVTTPWGDYVISLWSKDSSDTRHHVDQEAMVLLPRISRIIFEHFTT